MKIKHSRYFSIATSAQKMFGMRHRPRVLKQYIKNKTGHNKIKYNKVGLFRVLYFGSAFAKVNSRSDETRFAFRISNSTPDRKMATVSHSSKYTREEQKALHFYLNTMQASRTLHNTNKIMLEKQNNH